jgi:hypothetical protein
MARRVFATRSPTLALLVMGGKELMGARLHLESADSLRIDVWCHEPRASQSRARLGCGRVAGSSSPRTRRVACSR